MPRCRRPARSMKPAGLHRPPELDLAVAVFDHSIRRIWKRCMKATGTTCAYFAGVICCFILSAALVYASVLIVLIF